MTQFDESMGKRLISFQIDTDLLVALDAFKNKGICGSRAETLHMVIAAGLKVLEPKIEDLEKAVQVLDEIKQNSVS